MLYLVALVILGCMGREAWSCSCAPKHPQTAYCNSPVVIRGKFIAQKEDNKRSDYWEYEIKTTKLFKAPEELGEIRYLYTAKMESLCGYQHQSTNKSQEFMITGYVVEGKVMIGFCGFIVPWDSLSMQQKRGFQQVYQNNCNCQIVPCFSVPCETQNDRECLWTDSLMKRKSRYSEGTQASHMACVQSGNDMCVWQSQKSRIGANKAN
ncbi:metalloproteinase inhibitor 1 [Discoglossus pictus]